jgi:Trypsin
MVAALSLLIGGACGAPEDDIAASDAPLIGGQVAKAGQFPATVALLTPLAATDTRYCMKEDRRCTMTRVGKRAYLAAGHCFADKDTLEREQRVVLSPLFTPGAHISLSQGVMIWDFVPGSCPEQTFGGQIAVPAASSVRLGATVRQVHFHPSYLTRGGEAGTAGSGDWTRFEHADVAVLEVEEDLTSFAQVAKVSFAPLSPGDDVVIAGHGMSGGFVGTMWSGLKFAARKVDALEGQDFYTRVSDPFGGPGIAPGDSGGAVFLAADPSMRTIVGVNSKSVAYRGSAHVRLDDTGPQPISAWYQGVLAQINQR